MKRSKGAIFEYLPPGAWFLDPELSSPTICPLALHDGCNACSSNLANRSRVESGSGLDLKQGDLATLVRGSRARVNLTLKELERAGVLAVERQLLVLDEVG